MRTLLLALVATVASAQVQADFFRQEGAVIGNHQKYAVKVTNGASSTVTTPGAVVWNQAKTRGKFEPQLISSVLAAKAKGTKTSQRALALRILSIASGAVGSSAATKLLGNVDPESAAGKAIITATPIVTVVLALAAEAVKKAPETDVDPEVDKMLPGLIVLPPHGSLDFIMWGVPL